MASKQELIAKVYYDKAGYGSKSRTLAEAREKDKSITKSDVDERFNKNIEIKTKPRGQNSYIPPNAFHELQFDLFFINDIPNQKIKVGALMIDIFSKAMTVIPIQSKSEGDVAMALVEGFKKMGGFCKLFFTDDESALNTKSIQDYLKEKGIKRYTTRNHAAFSEVAIKTCSKNAV